MTETVIRICLKPPIGLYFSVFFYELTVLHTGFTFQVLQMKVSENLH